MCVYFGARDVQCETFSLKLALVSASLIIGEMQTKTAMKYHLNSLRMVIIKKTKPSQFWQGVMEKEELSYTIGGNVN